MSENINVPVMPKGDELILSVSPHIHDKVDVRNIMIKVILTLLPATAAAIYYFEIDAVRVIAVTMLASLAAEGLWFWFARKPLSPLQDGSALLTGLLLALNLPGTAPTWVCVLGAFIAIWVGKQVFGGLGNNIFNPALVGRVALLIALPAAMTTWAPTRAMLAADREQSKVCITGQEMPVQGEFVTTATPLGVAKDAVKAGGEKGHEIISGLITPTSYKDYFFGNRGGSLGETSVLALLIGGIALMCMKLIKWQIPLCFIATVAICAAIAHFFAPDRYAPALFHVMNGGLLLGAFFMATDMVTSPITSWGCVVFGVGCGVVTAVIRLWGSYPEGVSFSILFMNALVPLIDRMFQLRPFGYVRPKIQEAAK
ncbi:MAG: RnfABCDGE type electron transport complex subunit D [Victivallaceae bacterium]